MKRYEYVIVIGVDGMGNFNRFTPTPNLDRIFENGAVTYNALSMVPTISAQNWGGMLLGCDPLVHTLTNAIVGSNLYENDALPSVFRRIREAYPDAVLASYCNWNPINYGIIEHNVGVDLQTADNDELLTEMIIKKISDKPNFLFIQFDNTDGAGHHYGYGKEGHLEEISRADGYIGRIYDEYAKLGMLDDTLFIVTADHGGYRRSHGGYTDGEKYVYLAAAGKGVKKGDIGRAYTKDISSTVLYALGIDLPEYNEYGYSSQVPAEIFENCSADYILPEIKEPSSKHYPYIPYGSENGLKSKFGNKLKLAMFFENSAEDETGNFAVEEKGIFKYYSDGIASFCGEGGANGCLSIKDFSVGSGSFSVSLWVETSLKLHDEAVICGNKAWDEKNDNDKGWLIVLRSHDILFFLADGENRFETAIPFKERSTDGWVHLTFSVDKENRKIAFYRDFVHVLTVDIEERYCINLDNMPLTVGDDPTQVFNSVLYTLAVRMDDLLIFDGTISAEENEILKNYYESSI